MENYNLRGTVYFPTRTTVTTSSMLDNIFIDKFLNFTIKPYINGLSDHAAQLRILNNEILSTPTSKTLTTRSFNNTNTATFLNYLSYENWGDVFMEKKKQTVCSIILKYIS
jgi:hypothetical protein